MAVAMQDVQNVHYKVAFLFDKAVTASDSTGDDCTLVGMRHAPWERSRWF